MKTDLDSLIEGFAEAVIKQDEATFRTHDRKVIGKCSRQLVRCQEAVWEFGDEGREAFARLLTHPYPQVRVNAAALPVGYKTDEALAVLRVEAESPGFASWGASESIKRWERYPKPIA